MESVNRVVAALYQGAFEATFSTFQTLVFNIIREAISFDSAMWLVGVHDLDQVNSVWYHDRAPIDIERYVARYGESDLVRQRSVAEQGVPFRIEDTMDIEAYRSLPVYHEASKPGGIEYAMGATLLDAVTSLSDFIVLYRADISQPFSDADRAAMQILLPHMIAAWRHRQLIETFTLARGLIDEHFANRRHHAVVDDRGTIHSADAGFGETISAAWPGWRGVLLPEPLRAFIASEALQLTTAGLGFVMTRGNQRHILTINGATEASVLSGAELRAARLFAEGKTHQEIGDECGISPHTARNQIAAAYRKLEVHTKLELARKIAQIAPDSAAA